MVDLQEVNKPTWKPRFLSDFSMGEYDFARFNITLTNIDNLSAMVNSCDVPSLELMQQLFAQLVNLWDNFRPLVAYATVAQDIDDLEKLGINLKRKWEQAVKMGMPMNKNYILNFVDTLRAYKRKLYGIKQIIGLGLKVTRNMGTAEKIKRGVRGDRNLDNLPEA
jgi:hypothetical protein